MSRYRFASPHDWLSWKIQENNGKEIAAALAQKISADEIQDLFQEEMDADGFFEDLDAVKINQEEYLELGGVCPLCESDDFSITQDTTEPLNNLIHCHAKCLSCGATWSEVYSLSGYVCLKNSAGEFIAEKQNEKEGL